MKRLTLDRLRTLHRRLDEEIRSEAKRRFPDGLRLRRLKKFKLAVKDRLARLMRIRASA
jgi:hypothetical protein